MTTPTNYPPLVDYLAEQIARSGKTHSEIALSAGFESAAFIQAILDEQIKLPLSYVKPLAKAIGADPNLLLNMAMTEFFGEVAESIMAPPEPMLTENERALIEAYRRITQGRDMPAAVHDARHVVAVITV